MRTRSAESLKQRIEQLKAERRATAEQLAKRQRSDARKARDAEAARKKWRGIVLEREQCERWLANPSAQTAELKQLDDELTDAIDRAAFGLPPKPGAAGTA